MSKAQKTITQRTDADRRVRQADRLAIVLRMLTLLLGRGKWDAKSLAAEFQCDERTIYRFLKILEFAGVPYVYDREDRCYRVRPDVKFPVLSLNRNELLEHATATVVSRAAGINVAADADPSSRKLAATSSQDVAELLSDAGAVMEVLDLKLADHSRHREAIKTIQWALIEGKQIAGEYATPHEKKTYQFTLHPYRLCLSGQAWYLISRISGEDRPKTFRVARFNSVRMLDSPAEQPIEFSLEDYFGNAWNVWRGGKTYRVEIEFTPEAADLVLETRWHKTQQVKRHKDGRATLNFTVDGLDEIVWWILGWSGRAKVIEPKELREKVVEYLHLGLQLNDA